MEQQEAGGANVAGPRANSFTQQIKAFLYRAWDALKIGWISFILMIFLGSQIVACLVILLIAKHEKPRAPLRIYIIGHACGCALGLALLFLSSLNQHVKSDKLQQVVLVSGVVMYLYFFAWLIFGWVVVGKAYDHRSDTPKLFWLSFVLVILVSMLGGGGGAAGG